MLLLCIMIGHWKVQKCRFPFKLGQQKTVSFLWGHFPHLQIARLPECPDSLKFHLLLAALQLPASKLSKSRLLPAQPSPNGPNTPPFTIHLRPGHQRQSQSSLPDPQWHWKGWNSRVDVCCFFQISKKQLIIQKNKSLNPFLWLILRT